MALSVGEPGIDIRDDAKHVARHALLRVLVAREIALHVTVGALHAERGPECAHRLLNIGICR